MRGNIKKSVLDNRVLVQFSWATSDLWLIQQNKFY